MIVSYEKALKSYIEKHRKLITGLMNVPYNTGTSELCTFANYLSYRAGEKHFEENGGKIDSRFIDDIRTKDFSKRNTKEMLKSIAWKERADLKNRKISLVDIFRSKKPMYAPKIENALSKNRTDYYRDDFRKINKSVRGLRRSVSDLSNLLSQKRSLHDPEYMKEIRKAMKSMNKSLDKCDFHAKSGIAWAVKSGIPYDHARNALIEVYLKHLDPLAKQLGPFDELMKTQGFEDDIVLKVKERRSGWAQDLILARFELQSEGQAVNRQQKRVFEQSQGVPTL